MDTRIVIIPADRIIDWDSFHDVFAQTLNFPPYYGRNLDALDECMGDLYVPGQIIGLRIENFEAFRKRCPTQYKALADVAAGVNSSAVENGDEPFLSLMLVG